MKAFIDLGTNTFHCKIVQFESGQEFRVVFYEKVFVKIGADGIQKGKLSDQALIRAKDALVYFRKEIEKFEVKDVIAIGTSAVRNAQNSDILVSLMKDWKWNIEVIDGIREAELIFKGILLDKQIPRDQDIMIMDIGGGSVEFVIGKDEKILWSQSFEIGAQRLKDQFYNGDEMQIVELEYLHDYLSDRLFSLFNAIEKFQPAVLIGSSGTFDTILSIRNTESKQVSNFVSYQEFEKINSKIFHSNLSQRKEIPGMTAERVEMIVVASALLNFVLKSLKFQGFYISHNALKEGLIYEDLQKRNQ